MTAIWLRIIQRNTVLQRDDDVKVTISVGNIRQLVDHAYEQGRQQGHEEAKHIKPDTDAFSDKSMFENIFGSKPFVKPQ